jgi:hypothetical protein
MQLKADKCKPRDQLDRRATGERQVWTGNGFPTKFHIYDLCTFLYACIHAIIIFKEKSRQSLKIFYFLVHGLHRELVSLKYCT